MNAPGPARNHHATVVVLGTQGVLIEGASGAGKTQLALALLGSLHRHGRLARLVADDQVLLAACGGRLVATCPASIAGLVEMRGLGPVPIGAEMRAVVDLAIRLVEPPAPRFDKEETRELCGISIPMMTLAACEAGIGARAVLARLGLDPFPPISA